MSDSYLALKSLHVLAAVFFLGNIIVTAWWKVMADRTRESRIIALAQRQVTLTDFVFTAGGVALILATGVGNAASHNMDIWGTRWLAWGMGLFIASGVIWGGDPDPGAIPASSHGAHLRGRWTDPRTLLQLGKLWMIFGILATILPLVNIYWMVFKPA